MSDPPPTIISPRTRPTVPARLDELDLRILSELSRDGRVPLSRLAQRLRVPRTTVNFRLLRLREEGIVGGFRAEIPPEKLGYRLVAFVLVKVRRTRPIDGMSNQEVLARSLVRQTAEDPSLPWVEEAHIITGEYDLLLKVRARELDQLTRFLIAHMATHDDVVQTHTLLALETVHEDHTPPLRP